MFRVLVVISLLAFTFIVGCQGQYGPSLTPSVLAENIWVPLVDRTANRIQLIKVDPESYDLEILNQYPISYPSQSLPGDELAILEADCPEGTLCNDAIDFTYDIWDMTYSAQNKSIAWKENVAWCPGTGCYGFVRIAMYDPKTQTKQVLVDLPYHLDLMTQQGITDIHWSPDGNSLGFVFFTDNLSQIRIFDIASKQVKDLENGKEPFTWSPDGKQIAFVSNKPSEQKRGISLISLDNKLPNTVSGAWDIIQGLDWSPDGLKIAITAWNKLDTDFPGYTLYIYDISTGQISELLNDKQFSYTDPKWSPDGSLLGVTSYSREALDKSNILFLQPDTGEITDQLTVNKGFEADEGVKWIWSRSGHKILIKSLPPIDKISIYNLVNRELKFITFPPQLETHLKDQNIWLGDPTW